MEHITCILKNKCIEYFKDNNISLESIDRNSLKPLFHIKDPFYDTSDEEFRNYVKDFLDGKINIKMFFSKKSKCLHIGCNNDRMPYMFEKHKDYFLFCITHQEEQWKYSPKLSLLGKNATLNGKDIRPDITNRNFLSLRLQHRIHPVFLKKLENHIIKQADHKCEYCGYNDNLKINFKFEYIKEKHTRVLVRIECLCLYCYLIKHTGSLFSRYSDYVKNVCDHFTKLTGMTDKDLKYLLNNQINDHYRYTISNEDLSLLRNIGIPILKQNQGLYTDEYVY